MTIADPERTGAVCPAVGGPAWREKRASSIYRNEIGHLKSHLLRRFQQLEIYVASYLVEVH